MMEDTDMSGQTSGATSGATGTREIFFDRETRRIVMIAEEGFYLTNYTPYMDILFYEDYRALDFPLTNEGYDYAQSFRVINEYEHNAYLLQRKNAEDALLLQFLNL